MTGTWHQFNAEIEGDDSGLVQELNIQRFMKSFGLCILMLIFCLPLKAAEKTYLEGYSTAEDERDGYVWDVAEERNEPLPKNLELIKPPESDKPPLQQVIFSGGLEKEIVDRYREKLGYTEAEQALRNPIYSSDVTSSSDYRAGAEANQGQQQDFANYMFRRLGEYHVDNMFKSDPKLKSVWDLKEKVSNVDVRFSQTTKVNTNYSFSGNYFTSTVENPWITSRLRIEMNPSSFGPAGIDEYIYSLIKSLSPSLSLESHYRYIAQNLSVIARKQVSPTLQTTLTCSTAFRNTDIAPQQSLILAGLLYVY